MPVPRDSSNDLDATSLATGEMLPCIQTRNVLGETARRKQQLEERIYRSVLVGLVVGAPVWLIAGLTIHGGRWLRELSGGIAISALVGFVMGLKAIVRIDQTSRYGQGLALPQHSDQSAFQFIAGILGCMAFAVAMYAAYCSYCDYHTSPAETSLQVSMTLCGAVIGMVIGAMRGGTVRQC